MWFRNNQTGVVWEVIDEDSIKRCQNDPNYEQVEEPVKESDDEVKKKEKNKTADNNTTGKKK